MGFSSALRDLLFLGTPPALVTPPREGASTSLPLAQKFPLLACAQSGSCFPYLHLYLNASYSQYLDVILKNPPFSRELLITSPKFQSLEMGRVNQVIANSVLHSPGHSD